MSTDPLGVGVGDGIGPSLVSPPGEWPGAGVELWAVPPPASGAYSRDGVPEGTGASSDLAGEPDVPAEEEPRPVTASLTVVPVPPLKLLPDASSYVVMPAIVTPNTTAAAITGRRRLFTRAR
ncbi:hypothetical protein ACQPXS_33575 [Streptomyces sp. CA-142005]|uniref:hypothetical protein n=1 Tax=Streptomyces sp. CA-142005 TaxID=3240052 RepID=UPI003D944AB2